MNFSVEGNTTSRTGDSLKASHSIPTIPSSRIILPSEGTNSCGHLYKIWSLTITPSGIGVAASVTDISTFTCSLLFLSVTIKLDFPMAIELIVIILFSKTAVATFVSAIWQL